MKNLGEKFLHGISWRGIGQTSTQAIQLLTTIILAHLLTPRDFGLMAMLIVLMNFAMVVSYLNLPALVQRVEVDQELLSSIFWLNVMVGILLTALLIAAAPAVAWAFKEPSLLKLTIAFSAVFLVTSFGITHNALLQREIDFRSFALMEIFASSVAGAAAIVMAYRGFGVWSLVLQSILSASISLAVLWALNPWRPDFIFRWHSVREVMGFSLHASMADILDLVVRNIDNFLIGLFLGPGPLGIYSRAYAVMLVPVNRIAQVLSDVMFSSFAKIQDDKKYVKRMFLKMTRGVALWTFPMMLGVLSIAKPFVLTLFGPQWLEMVPVLQVLCLIGMIQSVTTFMRNIYLSQGEAAVRFRVELPLQLTQILGIVIGLRWGILGVAMGYAAASIVVSYPSVHFAGRVIGLRIPEFLYNLRGVLGCAAAMAAVLWKLPLVLPAGVSSQATAGIEILAGALIYWGLLQCLQVEAYREVKTILFERFLPAFGAAAVKS